MIGYFIDRIGPVKVMFFGLLGLSISTYLVSIASDPYTIIGLRLLLGLFLPVLWSSCAKIVSLYVSLERIGVASGVYDAGSLVGLSASFVVAGAISG